MPFRPLFARSSSAASQSRFSSVAVPASLEGGAIHRMQGNVGDVAATDHRIQGEEAFQLKEWDRAAAEYLLALPPAITRLGRSRADLCRSGKDRGRGLRPADNALRGWESNLWLE